VIAIFFCHFRATPEAYRGSQAGGLVGTVAAGLLQPLQCQNLNPLSKARDQTRNLRVSSQIQRHKELAYQHGERGGDEKDRGKALRARNHSM